MKRVKCTKHGEIFQIPTEDNEFLFGKYHDDIERCKLHYENYPSCKFGEIEL